MRHRTWHGRSNRTIADRRRLRRGASCMALFAAFVLATSCSNSGSTPSATPRPTNTEAPAPSSRDTAARPSSEVPAPTGSIKSSRPTETRQITLVEGAHVIGYAPIYLAMKRGYFADEGLAVDLITSKSSSEAVAAVVGGSALGGLTAATDSLNAIKSGAKVKIAYAISTQWGLVLTVSNNYMKQHHLNAGMPLDQKVKGLKGAKIGVSAAGSATALSVRVMLTAEGLDPDKDVTIVPIGTNAAAILASLENGAIDACMFSPPVGNIVASKGIGAPFIDLNTGEVPAFDDTLFMNVVVNQDAVSNDSEQLAGMGRALKRALQDIAKDPEGVLPDIVASFPNADPAVIGAAFKTALPGFVQSPVPVLPSSVQKAIDVLGIGAEVTPEQAVVPIELGTG